MILPPCFEKLRDLNKAIVKLDYETVEKMLNNSEIPLNCCVLKSSFSSSLDLPLSNMYSMKDPRMAQLFLGCPRIDWLAFKWKRNLRNLEEEFGFQYESIEDEFWWKDEESRINFDYFYYLEEEFIKVCPTEGEKIYEKIIEELVKVAKTDNNEKLLLKTCEQYIPFKIALRYSSNIHVKNENNQSPIQITSDAQVKSLLIDLGANEKYEETPAIDAQVKVGSCYFASEEYFKHGILPDENIFLHQIKNYFSCLSQIDLEKIFERCPRYREIFESDLPSHLCFIRSCLDSQMSRGLDDENLKELLKNLIIRSKGNEFYMINFPKPQLLKKHAQELLIFAAKANHRECVLELMCDYGADPNSNSNGIPALFVAGSDTIEALLEHGADPFIKYDGRLFFEREDFCKGLLEIDASWLFLLAKKGFDIFKSGERTGKSLFESLDPKINLLVTFHDRTFSFPLSKLTQNVLAVFCCANPDLFAPIDEDDNTILHYFILDSTDFMRDRLPIELKSVSELKKLKNKFGISLFDSLVQNDVMAYYASSISDLEDFKDYAKLFFKFHGFSVTKAFGGSLLLRALLRTSSGPNWLLAEYLIADGVSVNRFTNDETLGREILRVLCRRFYNEPTQENINDWNLIFDFVIRNGYKLHYFDYPLVMLLNRTEILIGAIESINDQEFLNRIIIFMSREIESIQPLNDAFRSFFSHPKVLHAPLFEGSTHNITVLDQYFFVICTTAVQAAEKTRFMLQLGVDPRHVIGSEARPDLFNNEEIFREFAVLYEAGWTLSDLKNIKYGYADEETSIYDYYMSSEPVLIAAAFGLDILAAVPFDQLNLDEIYGNNELCAICKEPFEQKDKTILLTCKHIFHEDCSRSFLMENSKCPYCSSPLDFTEI